jgi:hypothetical protein
MRKKRQLNLNFSNMYGNLHAGTPVALYPLRGNENQRKQGRDWLSHSNRDPVGSLDASFEVKPDG